MDLATNVLREFRRIFVKEEKCEKKRDVSRFEGYFEFCYKILSWENASLTLTTFLILNFIFWLVIHFQLRFMGIIFLLILLGFIADACLETTQYFKVESSHLEVLDEVKNDINDLILSLKALRKDSPSSFCIGMSLIFLTISFIAKNISGDIIFYLVLLGVFFIPLAISKLPPKYIVTMKKFMKVIQSEKGVLAEEELIPFISGKDFNQRDPDLDSLLTDKTADSVTNSLISGLNSMPSHLDAEDKESLEEEDLLPSSSNHDKIAYTPGDISSDSDSDNKCIRFESGHFNGDSSSEEEMYAKHLSFVESKNLPEKMLMDNLVNVTAVGENLMKMASMIKQVVTNPSGQRKDSSSDSEFEIINSDDVKEQ